MRGDFETGYAPEGVCVPDGVAVELVRSRQFYSYRPPATTRLLFNLSLWDWISQRQSDLLPTHLSLASKTKLLRHMDVEKYLSRIGLERSDVEPLTLPAITRLQRAHLTSVPFETFSVAGGPFGKLPPRPEEVSLEPSRLYEKIVEDHRGGICYELNELFRWLLEELGAEAHRLAARVVSPEGTLGPPGDHQPLLVALDDSDAEPHMVDVGFGGDVIWSPLPLDGTPQEGPEGDWRLAESDRPDADYVAQSRGFGFRGEGWSDRFVFRAVPRDRSYLKPACEYHQHAPDATFTEWVLAVLATQTGHKVLSGTTFTEVNVKREGSEKRERSVSEEEWTDLVRKEFGIDIGRQVAA